MRPSRFGHPGHCLRPALRPQRCSHQRRRLCRPRCHPRRMRRLKPVRRRSSMRRPWSLRRSCRIARRRSTPRLRTPRARRPCCSPRARRVGQRLRTAARCRIVDRERASVPFPESGSSRHRRPLRDSIHTRGSGERTMDSPVPPPSPTALRTRAERGRRSRCILVQVMISAVGVASSSADHARGEPSSAPVSLRATTLSLRRCARASAPPVAPQARATAEPRSSAAAGC
jgi:hypothetical protein